jgi:hypothetical protein
MGFEMYEIAVGRIFPSFSKQKTPDDSLSRIAGRITPTNRPGTRPELHSVF